MTIDDIVEQHKTDLSKRKRDKQRKSFSYLFWGDFCDRSGLLACRWILAFFPIIAVAIALLACPILCDCLDNCADCIVCNFEDNEDYRGPMCILLMAFTILAFSIACASEDNVIMIISDIVTLICTLVTLAAYDLNKIITVTACVLYMLALFAMFVEPVVDWYERNYKKQTKKTRKNENKIVIVPCQLEGVLHE